jgi:hypothetical protein
MNTELADISGITCVPSFVRLTELRKPTKIYLPQQSVPRLRLELYIPEYEVGKL